MKKNNKKRIALVLVMCISSISAAIVAANTYGNSTEKYIINECAITVENGATEIITSEIAKTEIITETTTVQSYISGGGGKLHINDFGETSTEYITETSTELTTKDNIELPYDNSRHFAYMNGYPDNTFRAGNSISRAETSAILSRLLNNGSVPFDIYYSTFSDVSNTHWAYREISANQKIGLVLGYPDGTFRPDASITRAEFTAMITKFINTASINVEGHNRNDFYDAIEHWAAPYIMTAAEAGIVSGYPDGTFRPDAPITRAEAVSIVNRLTNRNPDKDFIDNMESLNNYSDLNKSYWAFYDIVESSNNHNFYVTDIEKWLNS